MTYLVTASICKPVIKAHRTSYRDHGWTPHAWFYSMKCFEHDCGWTTAGAGTLADALGVAEGHQREWAEVEH